MELLLRKEATKCRVVERLSGDAHLLFPRGETTLAVRAYYAQDMKHLEPTIVDGVSHPAERLHGLEAFRDAFKYPVVFFILPDPKTMMDYLSRRNSFLHLAQNIMNKVSSADESRQHGDGKQVSKGNAKTFVVPDSASAIDSILIFLDALHPDRRQLREQYYQHIRTLHFLPHPTRGDVPDPRQASNCVAQEIRALAVHLGLAAGEDEILMNRLTNLATIANADYRVLRQIPIEEASKRKLHDFFGSQADTKTSSLPQKDEGVRRRVVQASHGAFSQNFQPEGIDPTNMIEDDLPDFNEFHRTQEVHRPVNQQAALFHQQRTPASSNFVSQQTSPPFAHHPAGYSVHPNDFQNSRHFIGSQAYERQHCSGPYDNRMMMEPPPEFHHGPASQWLHQQPPRPYSDYPTLASHYSYPQEQQFRPQQPPAASFHRSGYTPGKSTMGQFYV